MDSSMLSSSCRCCASEGAYKDVKSSYHWMGEEEIYADMLKECFDVTLSPASDGLNEGGICEICITQLRNAANFKKQVLHTEEQFKNKLQSGFFKPEIVKVEVPGEDGNDTDDNNASVEEGFSGPEFDVPIKSESPEEPKAKKRAAKKGPTTRAKKAKSEDAETSTKRDLRKPKKSIIRIDVKTRRIVRKEIIEIQPNEGERKRHIKIRAKKSKEIQKHTDNLITILQCSNATPIRRNNGIGYACCYCNELCIEAGQLKKHTLETHDDKTVSTYLKTLTMPTYIIKLDITELRCQLCTKAIDDLNLLVEHLTKEHGKFFYRELKSHIVPFRFDGETLRCAICTKEYNNFKVLLEHMNVHFRNHICDVCGGGFVNKRILQTHMYRHKTGSFGCLYCSKIFDTHIKKRDHERAIHICFSKRSKCGYCGEKFSDYTKKNDHEVKLHGAKPVVLKCQACDKTFDNQRSLTVHTKGYHLMEKRVAK